MLYPPLIIPVAGTGTSQKSPVFGDGPCSMLQPPAVVNLVANDPRLVRWLVSGLVHPSDLHGIRSGLIHL